MPLTETTSQVMFKMLKLIVIGCILITHVQPFLSGDGADHHDYTISHPIIYNPSPEVAIGENVTLKCFSRNSYLPIKYTLYKGKDIVVPPVRTFKRGEEAEFHFTINTKSELGDYQCKADNRFVNVKYSPHFNFTLRDPISHPRIYSPSSEVTMGETVTLKCFSRTGSLPIKYMLIKGKDRALPPVRKNKKGEEAEFHFTVNTKSDLGEYRCKAESKFAEVKYSPRFNFTLRKQRSDLVVFIVPLLLSKFLLLVLAVAVPLLIHPWC